MLILWPHAPCQDDKWERGHVGEVAMRGSSWDRHPQSGHFLTTSACRWLSGR